MEEINSFSYFLPFPKFIISSIIPCGFFQTVSFQNLITVIPCSLRNLVLISSLFGRSCIVSQLTSKKGLGLRIGFCGFVFHKLYNKVRTVFFLLHPRPLLPGGGECWRGYFFLRGLRRAQPSSEKSGSGLLRS